MKAVITIMWKEIRDNLRDKRSVFFALIYGPVLMPALMVGPLLFTASKHTANHETPMNVHVYGEERAPNLMRYLWSKNIDIETAPEDFKQSILDGEISIVLDVSETYGKNFSSGSPARVVIHYDKEENESQRDYWKLRADIDSYSRRIALNRMTVRGLDQTLLLPIDIAANDLSDKDFGAGVLANIIMFLTIFSMMMGGFYLAIDATAGERERLSLEPLLSLPVTRLQVVLGKYFAISVFVIVSFVLPIISVAILVKFFPEDFFGNADVPTLVNFLKIILISFPISLFMSGFLMAIAAFSKSNKEAQTQMGFAMLFPMAPFFVVQFADVKLDSFTSAVPIMSQYLLADKIMVDSTYSVVSMLPGAATTIFAGMLLFSVAVFLYRRDEILG